jgi:Rrf2 family protein
VRSFRGATRGYCLSRPASEISLREVVEAIEGPGVFERCIFWSHHCADENPCILHEGWKQLKPKVIGMMEVTTLQDLVRRSVAVRKKRRGG